MKRFLSSILIIALIISLIPANLFTVTVNAVTSSFAGGSGTAADPYLIETKEQLNNVRNNLSAYYKMIADIVFTDADFSKDGAFYNSGYGFSPISNTSNAFTGTFDGNGHVIKNLKIKYDTDLAALFGNNRGVIKNVGIVDVLVKTSYDYSSAKYASVAGAVAGWNSGTIENCYSTGSVSALDSNFSTYAGGIVGWNYATIENCYSNCSVVASNGDSALAGGITGSNDKGTIVNCYNMGTVTATMPSSASAHAYAGGLAAKNSGTIENCYNMGTLQATSEYSYAYAGGITAANSGAISKCYNRANLSASGGGTSFYFDVYAYAGGVAGYNKSGSIDICCNTGYVRASNSSSGSAAYIYAGGIAGYSGSINNCYNIGNVTASANAPYGQYVYAGGISACYATLENCYNIGDVVASAYGTHATYTYQGEIIGTGGSKLNCYADMTVEELRASGTYTGFDFDSIWTMAGNACYPYAELKDVCITSDHIYTGKCDSICDCGYSKESAYEHSFTALYDADFHFKKCTECYDVIDIQEHSFDNDCDAYCDCGYTRTVPAHFFDNTCDTDCNICGYSRAINHTYDNACDTTCNVCGCVRAVSDHVFDNDCDSACNECGFARDRDHLYDMECDVTCNKCGATRVVPHFYDDESDSSCNLCGHNRAKASGKTGDCDWYVIDTTLYITGNGTMVDYNTYSTLPWGQTITGVVIKDGVTKIGSYAFYSCSKITTVTIADSVTSIGDYAFCGCSSLTSITTGKGVTKIGNYAFSGCSKLSAITIPGSVVSVGEYAFSNCTSLADVTIEDGVATIGNYAFNYCYALNSINVPGSVTSIGDYAFRNCSSLTSIVMNPGTIKIGKSAFYSCSKLSSITIPNSVTTIGANAFYSCSALSSVYITDLNAWCEIDFADYDDNPLYRADNLYLNGEKVTELNIPSETTTIKKYAFAYFDGFSSVTIPSSVTSIGNYAFYKCTNLTAVTMETDIETIGSYAFAGCSSLASVIIPNSITTIGDHAFYECTGLSSLTIQNGVKAIGTYAFAYCNALTFVSIPDSVTSVANYAFYYCSGLTLVMVGDGITQITERSFYACSNLTDVALGKSVRQIDSYAFYSCSNLKEVWYKGTSQSDISISLGNTPLTNANWHCNVDVVGEHIYDSVCAIFCKICDHMRVAPHIYDNGCDTTCNICGDVRVVPDHSFTNYKSNGNATCVVDGTETAKCDRCNETNTRTEIGSALGHKYNVLVTVPTCTQQGYTTHTCHCGDSYVDSYVNALGHDMGAWHVTKESTCTETGIQRKDCSRCDYFETEALAATGHSYVAVVTAPSCTAQGYTTHTCHCGDSYVDTYVAATGHTYVPTVVKPTPSAQGYTLHTCHCGDSYKDNYVAALDLSAPKVSITVDAATGKPALSWANAGEGVTYEIHRATSKSSKYTKVATVATPDWIDTSASVGKTYYYKVKAVYAEDTSLNSDFGTVVSVTAKCATPKLTVKAGSAGKPVLTWNKITSAKKYEIWRSVDGSAFKKLTTSTKLTYTDTKATAGAECIYKVKALGSKSAYNGQFSETDSCYVTCAAPSITLKLDSKTGKPSLSWKKITGAKSYAIYRRANGGQYQLLTTTTAVSYKDQTAVTDNKYSYQVVTLGKAEVFNSVASAAKTITMAVKAPKLTGSSNTAGAPVVSWKAVDNAVSYKVYRSTKSSKSYKLVKTTEELSYTDTSVAVGKTYYYKVVAIGSNTESTMSSYLKLTGKCATPEIYVDSNAKGQPVITWGKITGAKKYTVYRSTSETSGYKSIGTSKTTSYTDTKATPGKVYYYKVIANASSSKYNSGYSNIVSCGVNCATPVVKTSNNASGKTVLSWSKVAGATKYEIYLLGGEDYVTLGVVTGTSWTDTDAGIGEGRYYGVRAIAADENYNSEVSEPVFGRTTCATPKITGKVGENKKPVITWGEVEGATKYIVYRSTSSSKNYKAIGEVTDGLSYEDLTAAKGKTYYYKVVAVGDGVESAQSNYVKVKSK